jgi:hypothetical protein
MQNRFILLFAVYVLSVVVPCALLFACTSCAP